MKATFSAVLLASCLSIGSGLQAQPAGNHAVARGSRPIIAADGEGRLHAAFQAYAGGAKVPDIFHTVSSDHGATWSTANNVSNTPGLSEHPDMAIEKSGAIDIVWTDTSSDPKNPEIFFSRSSDDGGSWSKPQDLSSTPSISTKPALAIGPDNAIHVVWADTIKGEKAPDIFYMCSKDAGKHWSPAQDLSNTTGASSDPAIAVGYEGTIHVVWADTTPGESRPDIYYSQCRHDTWTIARNISNSNRISANPSIACSKGRVYLTWSDNSRKEEAADIWLLPGKTDGKFDNVLNLSDSPGRSSNPKVTAEGDHVAVVWADTSPNGKLSSLYAVASHDNAGNFSTRFNLTDSHEKSAHPSIAIVGDRIYAVWEALASGTGSTIKTGSTDLKGLVTGPPLIVEPKLNGASGNTH